MKGRTKVLVLLLALAISLTGCGVNRSGNAIQIKGSDTEVNLVQRLAEEFMAENPDVDVAVTGGGSGTGIAALINSTADLANSSRAMKDEEIEQARANGVNPVAVIFATDGLSVIVHESNSVDALSLEDLGTIYRGEVTNWNDVGGPDMPISLYGRQSNSGTFIFFRDQVLRGEYSPRMKGMNGNAQIVEGVSGDRAGIGYVGIGYALDNNGKVLDGIKVLNVVDNRDTAVSPLLLENIISGVYPLTRPLYHYTNGKPQGNRLKFLQFELSEKGQQIVLQEGFYPVSQENARINQENLGSH